MRVHGAVGLVLSLAACEASAPDSAPSALPFCGTVPRSDRADVDAAYAKWKDELVTAEGAGGFRRVVRPDTPDGIPNSTVSEGIAYGMLLAVAMDDQALFDDLWRYAQLWADQNGLMVWYVDPQGLEACPGRDNCGAALDSDEDMAWALVQADARWGGAGALDAPYLDLAREQIDRIWRYEVEKGDPLYVLRPGDTWGGYSMTNPSYFAPAYYGAFGELTDNVDGWNKVIDDNYAVLFASLNADNGNENNGLAPAWCTADGDPRPLVVEREGETVEMEPVYQYDSARIPFRIAQHYCRSEDERAERYLRMITPFFDGIGASKITDGYRLDGAPRPDPDSGAGVEEGSSAVFVASAGVGAMFDPAYERLVQDAYDRVATLELLVRSRYYQLSWTAMGLLMMRGEFPDYGPNAPPQRSERPSG